METNENKQPQDLIEAGNTPQLIEMPESIRESLPIPVRDMGGTAVNVVVSRPLSEGRYGIPPVPVRKPEGIAIKKPGFDTFTHQAPTAFDTTSAPEHSAAVDTEES